jgi:hypothetical protein
MIACYEDLIETTARRRFAKDALNDSRRAGTAA